MSDSPIFDQLAAEYADKEKSYEQISKWSTPAFRWTGKDHGVQLGKQSSKSGVRFGKVVPIQLPEITAPSVTDTFSMELPGGITPWVDESAKQLIENARSMTEKASAGFGRLIQDYVSQVGRSFAETHPLAIVTDMHSEANDDGSATVVIEAVQPLTSVKPLSERNSAEPME